MKVRPILLVYLILGCFACTQHKEVEVIFEDCATLVDAQILPEAEKSNTCIYLEVYRYKSEIYTLCECCVCNKVPMAIDCDGEPLCDWLENCMLDFYVEAEYLFSIVSE